MGARKAWVATAVLGVSLAAGSVTALAQENGVGIDITVRAVQSFTRTVMTFETSEGGTSASDFDASINWGDGSSSAGQIVEVTPKPSCPGTTDQQCYEIRGTHTYATSGSFGLDVTLTPAGGGEELLKREATATVREYRGVDFSANAGQPFAGTVATFRDPGGTSASDFSAMINWGDGSATSAGVITQLPSCPSPPVDRICYEVDGTHTYASGGTFTVTVTINGPGSSEQVTASATIAGGSSGGSPRAQLALAQSTVRPGQLAVLDAGQSSGAINFFAFDINGNGTYETKCEAPYAGVVISQVGDVSVGVQAVGSGDSRSLATAVLSITGKAKVPPKGISASKRESVLGGCLEVKPAAVPAVQEAFFGVLKCPQTVQVGAAEATIPWSGDSESSCFKRFDFAKDPNKKTPQLKSPIFPYFLAQREVSFVNGLRINTLRAKQADNRLIVSEGLQEIFTQRLGKPLSDVRVRLGDPGDDVYISGKPAPMGRWNVAKRGVVGSFPVFSSLGNTTISKVFGLGVESKTMPVKFIEGYRSELEIFVRPPLNFAGLGQIPTGPPLKVRIDNSGALDVIGGTLVVGGGSYLLDLPLGIFHLRGELKHSKQGGSDIWSGSTNLEVTSSPIKNIAGTIVFRDGHLQQATVNAPIRRPGLGPIGCCIYIVELNGTLTPAGIIASARFAGGPTEVFGSHVAEALATLTIQYSPFSLSFVADQFKILKWDVGAKIGVFIEPHVLIANARFANSLGPLSWDFGVEVQAGKPWYIVGKGEACADVFPFSLLGCVNAKGGAGSRGITACTRITVESIFGKSSFAAGIFVPWNLANVLDYEVYWACGWGDVKAKVSSAQAKSIRAAARAKGAAASYPVRVQPGLSAALFTIAGRGRQPTAELRGPDGTTLTSPPEGEATTQGNNWLAVRETNDNTIRIIVFNPAGGVWKVKQLSGSAPISSVGLSAPLPSRFAKGRVSSGGRTRTLHYRVKRPPGTTVKFVERAGAPSGASTVAAGPGQAVNREIGRARGLKGQLRFVPAEAKPRRRWIEAVVTSKGLPIKTERVTTFTAPRFRKPAAPRVRARRSDGNLVATWTQVPGARRYQAFVNRSDGQTRYFSRAGGSRRIQVKRITGVTHARVEVRAVSAAGYIGKSGIAKLRRLPVASLPKQFSAAKVLRQGALAARCTASGDGVCRVVVQQGGRPLARGSVPVSHGQRKRIKVKLTKRGRRKLQSARRTGRVINAKATIEVPGSGVPRRPVKFR